MPGQLKVLIQLGKNNCFSQTKLISLEKKNTTKDDVDTSTGDRFDWMYLEETITNSDNGSVQLNYVIKTDSPS